MTIRSRLLLLLLPPLILFIALIFLFFFYNWNSEITASFRSSLKSIVITSAELVEPKDIEWINAHRNDPSLATSPLYQKYEALFEDLQKKLPVANLYIVSVESVKLGERVLLDKPLSEVNRIYDGTNSKYSHRQVYLIDSDVKGIYHDYSESDAHAVYYTKEPLITPIYKGLSSNQEFMTGYAPITGQNQEVIALVGADVNLDLLHRIVQHAILVMIASVVVAILFVMIAVFFIANKITEPVSELKNAALNLAAGDYEEPIAVVGPKEIEELASTLNTMRECLLDHINRLKDSSLMREKLYGEQECGLLLQNRMLDDVIDSFDDPRLEIRHLSSSMTHVAGGLKLEISHSLKFVTIDLKESVEEGFEGVFSLLNASETIRSHLHVNFDFDHSVIAYTCDEMPFPLLWSSAVREFAKEDQGVYRFQKGDFLFIFSHDLTIAFAGIEEAKEWLSKVMRQFSSENFDLMTSMLTHELNLILKKQHTLSHLHLFCIKLMPS